MKWPRPWRRLRPRDEQGHARADQALRRSDARLERTRRADQRAWGLADRIRQMREQNHLAEAIEQALKEER